MDDWGEQNDGKFNKKFNLYTCHIDWSSFKLNKWSNYENTRIVFHVSQSQDQDLKEIGRKNSLIHATHKLAIGTGFD